MEYTAMEKPIIVYATGNPGKLAEMKRLLGHLGFETYSMQDLGCRASDVPETGTSLGENAIIKVTAYARELLEGNAPQGRTIAVLSDDTGFVIPALNGEPGIYVRRWRDRETHLSDEEIIAYALERMRGLAADERRAEMRCSVAVAVVKDGVVSEPLHFEGALRGHVLEQPASLRLEGFPLASLFFIDEYGMLLGDIQQLPDAEKPKYLSHRERAVAEAVRHIRSI